MARHRNLLRQSRRAHQVLGMRRYAAIRAIMKEHGLNLEEAKAVYRIRSREEPTWAERQRLGY